MQDTFNVRATYTWKPDRLYRVYYSSGQLYFIRIGGQGYALAQLLELQLGPFGKMLGRAAQRRSDAKLAQKVEETDRIPPEVRIREHKHNFQIGAGDVTESTILPASQFASHGIRFGRWNVSLRGGSELRLQFEQLDDMQIALELLTRALGNRLSVEVEWDARASRFVKRSSGPVPTS